MIGFEEQDLMRREIREQLRAIRPFAADVIEDLAVMFVNDSWGHYRVEGHKKLLARNQAEELLFQRALKRRNREMKKAASLTGRKANPTKKREYLDALMEQSPEWIRASAKKPSAGMRPIHQKLHAVALRKKAGRKPNPTNAIGYMGAESRTGPVTDFEGREIGRYEITSSWRTPKSYVSDRMFSLLIRMDDGTTWTGRSAGKGMAITGKPKAGVRKSNPRNPATGNYRVHYTNHGYFAQDEFATFDDALRYGKSKGFEFSILSPEGELLSAWSPIGGRRDLVRLNNPREPFARERIYWAKAAGYISPHFFALSQAKAYAGILAAGTGKPAEVKTGTHAEYLRASRNYRQLAD